MLVSVWKAGSVMSFWLSASSLGAPLDVMDVVVPARSRPCFSPVLASPCAGVPWEPWAGAPWLAFDPLLMRRIFLDFSVSEGLGVSSEWSGEFMFDEWLERIRYGVV